MKHALGRVDDPTLWRLLLRWRLDNVEHGMHHLDEGQGLVEGSPEDYVLELMDALAVVGQAPPGVFAHDIHAEIADLWSLLRDWCRYADAGRPGGDFPRWCAAHGSTHWVARGIRPVRYYYQPKPRRASPNTPDEQERARRDHLEVLARDRLARGGSVREVADELLSLSRSPIDAIQALYDGGGISLADAKIAVDECLPPSVRAANDRLRASIIEAARSNTPP